MCLAEFAATLATNYKHTDDIASDTCNDVLPCTSTVDQKLAQITHTDGFGKMTMRPRPAVSQAYAPWFDEATDLLGGYATFEEHYFRLQSVVLANKRKYMLMRYSLVTVAPSTCLGPASSRY